MTNKQAILEQIPFWSRLSEDERKVCSEAAVLHTKEKGTVLRGCSGSCLGMLLVISGCIRASMLSEEGREITLFRIEQGKICVLSARCVLPQITFDTQMTVEEDSEILMIPSACFNQLTENNIYVRCFTYELISERFSSVMWTLQQILFFKFDHRLATYLLGEYAKTGKKRFFVRKKKLLSKSTPLEKWSLVCSNGFRLTVLSPSTERISSFSTSKV